MQEKKKYFQQKFLLFKCHLAAEIPFGGKSWFLLDRHKEVKEYHKQLATNTG